jgi:hypothetical protein
MNGIPQFEVAALMCGNLGERGKRGFVDCLPKRPESHTTRGSPFAMWCSGMSSSRLAREFVDRQIYFSTILFLQEVSFHASTPLQLCDSCL